jgi:hypothetical protein
MSRTCNRYCNRYTENDGEGSKEAVDIKLLFFLNGKERVAVNHGDIGTVLMATLGTLLKNGTERI